MADDRQLRDQFKRQLNIGLALLNRFLLSQQFIWKKSFRIAFQTANKLSGKSEYFLYTLRKVTINQLDRQVPLIGMQLAHSAIVSRV